MKKGLIIGKFLPLHLGHLALIEFGQKHCDALTVLVCAAESESIPGPVRLQWIQASCAHFPNVRGVLLTYDERELPNTSESSEAVSQVWTSFLQPRFPDISVIFSSEPYGAYVARHWGIEHRAFDPARAKVPVSGTAIRQHPCRYWDFLPAPVRPWYLQKVAILGTESTGKSTLAARLAAHFETCYVPEAGREIVPETEACQPGHLPLIAETHARAIQSCSLQAHKLLFLDTDLHITRSYARFLFDRDLLVPEWVKEANRCQLYLYLAADAPYVQDGTRLELPRRNLLDASHRRILTEAGISWVPLSGDWEARFAQACAAIEQLISQEG